MELSMLLTLEKYHIRAFWDFNSPILTPALGPKKRLE